MGEPRESTAVLRQRVRNGTVVRGDVSIAYAVHHRGSAAQAEAPARAVAAADTAVLLSGAGTDGTLWRQQIDRLGRRLRVVTIDNRGSGRSSKSDRRCSLDNLVDDVVAVLDAESLGAVSLVGFSLGGLVAQRLVSRHPHRVSKLVLMNCTLGAAHPETIPPEPSVLSMLLFGAALTEAEVCRNLMDFNFGVDFRDLSPTLYETYCRNAAANARGIRDLLPAILESEPLIADYAAIKSPVLCIQSQDDPVTPPRNGDGFTKAFVGCRVEYLPGAHASMLLHPQRVSALLEEFLIEGSHRKQTAIWTSNAF